ncbi:Histidine kinase-, DNA gyrase B-, and HSP90-like ATPase [Micromonospora rifamycinica]|uniref:histidine kinase n=3 Tax=Micromonospora rifamycinica TaxID=291594 RepID=A0A1C5H1I6_9ACTN|nr:Histidine kinase-, DNA gyrase B-, and HSP90-like ATPase [Micromonospora rifamycinica]
MVTAVVSARVLRQWPWAVPLVVLGLLDIRILAESDTARLGWTVPGIALMATLALLAQVRPVPGALGAAATLVVSTGVLRAADAETTAGLAVTEIAAVAIVIVAVVRRVPGVAATGLVGLLLATSTVAAQLRPQYAPPPGESTPEPWWSLSLSGMAMVVLPVAYGWYLRSRDRQRARTRQAAVIAVQQRERLALARELRDVVTHQVRTMMDQAQSAQERSISDPGAALDALPVIERSGIEALSSMRHLVAALREGEPGEGRTPAPLTRTTDLAADLRAMSSAGSPPVRVTVELAEPVAEEVATSVLRLVQESVSNARRHAVGARQVEVSVRTGQGHLRVEIRDDGKANRPIGRRRGGFGVVGRRRGGFGVVGRRRGGFGVVGRRRGGSGLVGMRERVRLLGGRFTAGRTSGGWQVLADLPLYRAEP